MVEIITFDRGDTIRINNIFTDMDTDEAYDPTTITLKIYDPKGVVIKTVTYAAAEIIKSDTGTYYYDYDIADDALIGKWISKWIGVVNGFTDVSKDQFTVGDPDKKLYCTVEEVWNRAGVDSNVATRDEVIPLIKESMGEIDAMMGKSFQYGTSITQWFDTNRDDDELKVTSIYLNYKPIITITSLEEYDVNSNLITTHEAADYWLNTNTGRLTLLSKQFTKQVHRVKSVYTYGAIEVPQNISSLCALFSVMKLLIHQIGGTYDDVTSWSAAGLNISVGEPYMNMSRDIEFMQKEATRLIANIGRLRPSAFIL